MAVLDRRVWLGFVVILLLAGVVRIAGLGTNPPGVFHDEAEKGYSAYSLLVVGGVMNISSAQRVWDGEAGRWVQRPSLKKWPLFVNVWGSYTSMIYQYAAMPFVAVGGLNAWTLRLPSALVGTATVGLVFFLVLLLFDRSSLALWAMGLVAVSPWHVVCSRWAMQGTFAVLFIVAGLCLFLLAMRYARWRRVVFAGGALAFGLAFYAYSGARPFLLLLWVLMGIVWWGELRRCSSALWPGLVVFAVLVGGVFLAMFSGSGEGMARFQQLSVFQGGEVGFGAAMVQFAVNYAHHYSPSFLFFSGDGNVRHSVPGFGQMLLVEAPFLLVGIGYALKRRERSDWFLLGWFLIFPVSAALTNEGIPHGLRTLFVVPCVQILVAMGIVRTAEWCRERQYDRFRIGKVAGGVIGVNAAAFIISLFVTYPFEAAPAFEYGVERGVEAFRAYDVEHGGGNKLVVEVGGRVPFVYELFLYHLGIGPERVRDMELGDLPVVPVMAGEGIDRALENADGGACFLIDPLGWEGRLEKLKGKYLVQQIPLRPGDDGDEIEPGYVLLVPVTGE